MLGFYLLGWATCYLVVWLKPKPSGRNTLRIVSKAKHLSTANDFMDYSYLAIPLVPKLSAAYIDYVTSEVMRSARLDLIW